MTHSKPYYNTMLGAATGVALFAVGCAPFQPGSSEPPSSQISPTETPIPEPTDAVEEIAGHEELRLRAEIVEQNAGFPVSLEFAPDGRLFYLARTRGAVMVKSLAPDADGDAPPSEPVLEGLPLPHGEGDGLLSLALAPDFGDSHHFYLYYTVLDDEGTTQGVRIVRYTEIDGRATEETPIIDSIPIRPEQRFHFGGALSFGPDGKLYLIYGDTDHAPVASDPEMPGGSVLRFNPDGSIPEDNPFPGSPVYSYGHRNGFGLAWHPESGLLYESENGMFCDDELNLIVAGKDYGWGSILPPSTCPYPDGQGVPPLYEWTPNIAPTGMLFYTGEVLPELRGNLLMCAFNTGLIYRIEFNDAGDGVQKLAELRLQDLAYYCGLDIAQGPDGWLYTSTPGVIVRIGR